MLGRIGIVFQWLGLVWRYWPKVLEVVRYVETMQRAATSEAKKAIAKQLLQDKLPPPPGWCDADWDAFIGGLIDAVVAVLNWRGVFRHGPGHQCAQKR